MDRFIDSALKSKIEAIEHLKSSMDRFIDYVSEHKDDMLNI